MFFKNTLKAGLLGLAMSFAITGASAAEKQLIVATDTSFIPFEFKHGSKYTGFDVQLWEAIAKQANLEYKLQPMDFNRIIPGLQTHNIDVALAGIAIRDDRAEVIDFSDPYYESGLAILVANGSDIKTAEDLAGKTVAVKIGTVTVDYMKSDVPDAKLKMFPNIDNAFLELASGQVDAVVHDTPNVQYYAQTAGDGKFKVVGSLKSGDFYGVAFPKGSDLVPVINDALAELKSNGVYDRIYKKWFGSQP